MGASSGGLHRGDSGIALKVAGVGLDAALLPGTEGGRQRAAGLLELGCPDGLLATRLEILL